MSETLKFTGQKATYVVIEEIGAGIGSMGKIYKVYQEGDPQKKTWVLKKIDLQQIEKEWGKHFDIRTRAEREYMAGQLIVHDNVVHNIDYGYTDNQKHTFFIVMDYYPHGSLADIIYNKINNGQKFSFEEIKHIIFQLLSGLYTIHNEGIIHRDIKAENVLCDNDRYALCDFGICGFVSSRITRGNLAGTPAYMPPQQREENPEYLIMDSLDIYAFGVLMYYLFSLKYPFGKNDDDIEYLQRQIKNKWDDIKLYRPDIPQIWEETIYQCLHNDLKSRFTSIDEVIVKLMTPSEIRSYIPAYKPNKALLCKYEDDVILKVFKGAEGIEYHNLKEISNSKKVYVLTIGRNHPGSNIFNHINVNEFDEFLSRRHATIERHPEKNCYYFLDGQFTGTEWKPSTNGSSVCGKIVKPGERIMLSFNDKIIIGETTIIIEKPDQKNKPDNMFPGQTSNMKKDIKEKEKDKEKEKEKVNEMESPALKVPEKKKKGFFLWKNGKLFSN